MICPLCIVKWKCTNDFSIYLFDPNILFKRQSGSASKSNKGLRHTLEIFRSGPLGYPHFLGAYPGEVDTVRIYYVPADRA